MVTVDGPALREHLIKLGIIVPRPMVRFGEATPEPERPGVPCVRLDHAGREAARHPYRGLPSPRVREQYRGMP